MPFGCVSSCFTDITDVFSAFYTQTDQIPSAGDTWLSAAADSVNDTVPGYVQIEDDGDTRPTVIRFLKSGTYQIFIAFEYAATGSPGSMTILYGRRLINGLQVGATTSEVMDTQDSAGSSVLSAIFRFEAGDTLQYQIAYDATEQPGGLETRTVPSGLSANPAPCFSLRVQLIS